MANNNGYKKDNKAKQQPDYTSSSSILEPEDDKTTLMMERETCDVLCSLSSAPRDFDNRSNNHDRGVISPADSDSSIPPKKKKTTGITNNKTCQKQLQLPMFLSKVSPHRDESSLFRWLAQRFWNAECRILIFVGFAWLLATVAEDSTWYVIEHQSNTFFRL